MAKRRLTISLREREAGRITRECIRKKRLVYVILTDKKLRYGKKRSRIAYIGTTRKGVSRVLGSLAKQARTILKWRGIRECQVKLVTCTACPGVESWRKLERAMLVVFKTLYGRVPLCNRQEVRTHRRNVFDFFRESRVRRVIEDLS